MSTGRFGSEVAALKDLGLCGIVCRLEVQVEDHGDLIGWTLSCSMRQTVRNQQALFFNMVYNGDGELYRTRGIVLYSIIVWTCSVQYSLQ